MAKLNKKIKFISKQKKKKNCIKTVSKIESEI